LGRIVATLIRLIGDFDVAEERPRKRLPPPWTSGRFSGVPEYPPRWIIQTARHKALDRIRRRTRFEEKIELYAGIRLIPTIEEPNYDTSEIPMIDFV
jgi:RNA polymerase sigma-70 factor (ECF subfamily)